MANRAITLRDVAAAAGVHVSTASKALDASKERLVNAETRSRVRSAADALGYRPHLLARGLRRGRTGMVGVVLPDIGNPYVALLVRGMRDVLEKADLTPMIVETDDDAERLERVLDRMASHRVDGVIVGCARLGDEQRLRQFDAEVAPVVLAVRRLPGSGLPAFTADDLAGGGLAGGYLIGLGHTRLSQFEGPADVQPFLDRGSGFRAAAARHAQVEVIELPER
ncbi:MAG TPA: LacI family DNA-binding transcriptional regulator, partial [Acidimicrobiales bacterium]|nr:LacI family DNA-binding transcriptional regulator [Acidimicrobiales bacterium]